MSFSKVVKKYFFKDKTTLLINVIILLFCIIFVIISNISNNKKIQLFTKLNITDFPPYLVDSFNSSIYGLDVKTYKSNTNDKVELRQITLSWKRGTNEKDENKINTIKSRIIKISDRYRELSKSQVDSILADHNDCLIYLYNDQSYMIQEILSIESNLKYLNWFINNLDKLIILERAEIKFTDTQNIIEVIFSSFFLTILFIILINFVRFQREKL